MNKIKLKFSEPVLFFKGIKTIMVITANIMCGNAILNCKRFSKAITLYKEDKYDLNKAKNILQASLEQKAYLWAKKFIDKEIEKRKFTINNLKTFSEKATYIIEHDNDYINKLMI